MSQNPTSHPTSHPTDDSFDSVFQRISHPYEGKPLVLVTGVGRSGTTALRTALGQHPNLHETNRENNVLYDFLHVGKQNCTIASRRFAMATDDATYVRLLRLYLLNLLWPLPRQPLEAVHGMQGFSALTQDRLAFLREVFPQVKVVLIVRHGVEVVASRMVYPGFRDQSFEAQCHEWQSGAQFAIAVSQDADVLTVRHEQLLDQVQQAQVMQRVIEFAGLSDHRSPLESLQQRQHHPTQMQGETLTAAADLSQRSQRWQLWTEPQQQQFTEICGPGMMHLNYNLTEGVTRK